MITLLSALSVYLEPVRSRLRTERGLETVEYALIAALIAVVVIASVTTLGTSIRDVFTNIANTIQTGAN